MVYEGNMTSNGMRNGWGILYDGEYMLIGWFLNDIHHGNVIMAKGKEWSIV